MMNDQLLLFNGQLWQQYVQVKIMNKNEGRFDRSAIIVRLSDESKNLYTYVNRVDLQNCVQSKLKRDV